MKVVTSQEMARVEAWAVERGADTAAFMAEAGRKVALAVQERLESGKKVYLLVGKGNKGGDAYTAGIRLVEAGYQVCAEALYPHEACSPLNQALREQFDGAEFDLEEADLILDGLLGTGYHGALEPKLESVIRRANESGKPIIAIDIPSGLNGTTGEVESIAICAAETIALGFPKIGFFLRGGWKWVGELRVENFGLSDEAEAEAKAVAVIPEEFHLPPMERVQHKYSRGFALGFGGSKQFPGAIKLSGLSALHAGAGIVKIFGLEEIGPTANELIFQLWSESGWNAAMAKAQSIFIGPGLGRSAAAKEWLEKHLRAIEKPCVIDADALFFLPQIEKWPEGAILTPHQGEMRHLLQSDSDVTLEQCQDFVKKHRVILVLKGAPTMIFMRGKLPAIVPRGDPGMATAGSGDVLTGIIAALLAQGQDAYDAAILGVALHALSGEAAARAKTSYGYTASDLIDFLPEAFHFFLETKE